ncbi:MAG TPA: glycosyltransferase, partial [Candidatus Krumholzibacterium sp.]|nr:glycosyltransferase [Candidatus Krumholzibacterium sp.]
MKIVCFSEIQWRYVRTRKQQIIRRFPKDWEILFLSSVVAGKENNFRPMREGNITHVCVPAIKNFPQKSLRALFSFPPVRFLWNVVLFLWVKAVMSFTGFSGRERVFFVSNIYYAAILPFLGRRFILYDCNDDPLEFPNAPKWAPGYFTGLVGISDAISTVSRGLESLLHEMGARDVEYIGNGVDFDLFMEAIKTGIPEEMKGLRRPVLGYSGAIAEWFDLELLDMIAGAYTDASIVLFGPLFAPLKGDLEEMIDRRGNIFYLGSKPYEKLGAYIASLDVCMIPLRMNRLMRMADPNKLYEYAASGRPIVTYRFAPEMDDLRDLVYLADDREEFVDKVGIALREGADRDRLVEFARSCSWDERARAMVDLINRKSEETLKEEVGR